MEDLFPGFGLLDSDRSDYPTLNHWRPETHYDRLANTRMNGQVRFLEGCEELGVIPGPAVMKQLAAYTDMLLASKRHTSLIADCDLDTIWVRHLLDSMTVVPMVNDVDRLIDIGSGAGLPGLVLALQCPGLRVTILEATAKKCLFIEQVIHVFSLENVDLIHDRAERAAHQEAWRERFDMAVARAVAGLPALLELLSPFVRVGGRVIAMKGAKAEREVEASARACEVLRLTMQSMEHPLPEIAPTACILSLSKEAATPPKYPRREGIPAKRPL
jgi:16S rRNA (guanine527-N7)-methyltransferase